MSVEPTDARLYVARPHDLSNLAGDLDAVRQSTLGARSRLGRLTSNTTMCNADPAFRRGGFQSRHRRLVYSLDRFADHVGATAAFVARSATDAQSADSADSAFDPGRHVTVHHKVAWWAGHTVARSWQRTARGAMAVVALSDVVSAGVRGLNRGPAPAEAAGHRPGDPDGTFTVRTVGAWPESTGRESMTRAVELTDDGTAIGPDEFAVVAHSKQGPTNGPGRYTIILPGVVDLSRPQAGLDPTHRSVRDLDMAAAPSAAVGGVEDPYASMVAEALERIDIPVGAELALVGHSYGAAAAMVLAQDPAFNQRYDVSAVVAAAYYLDGEGPHSATTNAVLLENKNDLVVAAEGFVFNPAGGRWAERSQVVRFSGGQSRLGHDPSHYGRFLAVSDSAQVEKLAGRFEADGFDQPGTLMAVDVSVPQSARM